MTWNDPRAAAPRRSVFPLLIACLAPITGQALELSDAASLDVTSTAVIQHGDFAGAPDTLRGTVVTDLGLALRPTARDTFSASVGLAAGNALNTVSPVSLAPYADDLHDDLHRINGTSRSYLLTAWYRRELAREADGSLHVTAGLIDATAYLDANAYANDEVGQFMGDAFVNSTLANLPSYEPGAALEAELGPRWRFAAVSMIPHNINEDPTSPPLFDRRYHYHAAEIGYRLGDSADAGMVRLMAHTTSRDFLAPSGTRFERLRGVSLSADHTLGASVGGFARLAWQDDAAAVTHDVSLSGGLGFDGSLWGRKHDTAGLGIAWLRGAAGSGIDETWATEAWLRVAITAWSDLTADLQYVRDDMAGGRADTRAWVPGLRVNVHF